MSPLKIYIYGKKVLIKIDYILRKKVKKVKLHNDTHTLRNESRVYKDKGQR